MFHYCFLLCIPFFSTCHFLQYEILFFMSSLQRFSFLPLISLSPSLLFAMLIFPCLLLCLFQSPRIRLFFVLSGKKCCCNYFSSSSIILVIFFSPSLFFMLWNSIILSYFILCSACQILVTSISLGMLH